MCVDLGCCLAWHVNVLFPSNSLVHLSNPTLLPELYIEEQVDCVERPKLNIDICCPSNMIAGSKVAGKTARPTSATHDILQEVSCT